jgi:putative membrane protein
MAETETQIDQAEYRGEALVVRGLVGGGLMGLANLVPGISGGTMLLATGVYPQFIKGVAEVSTFRLRPKSVLILICIIAAALMAIVALAGPVSQLVIGYRWVMYSLFIGLTLGGVPVIWRMIRKLDAPVVAATIVGIVLMAVMALIGPGDTLMTDDGSRRYAMYFLAGLAGATAMVLPGVSGGYLLLILGQYVAILTAVSTCKDGVRAGDWTLVADTMHIIVPVGIGVVVGVVLVSNVVKLFLDRFERPTLGLLLGLLLGAVIGLWPFQEGVAPEAGSIFREARVELIDGQLRMVGTGRIIEPEDFPTAYFQPSIAQTGGAIGLIGAGLAASLLIGQLGASRTT